MKQGEKLLILARRDQRSSEEIAEAMGIDKSYLPRLYKLDKLPPKPLQKAQEVFGVSREYFISESEGKTVVNEDLGPYGSVETELARLQTEIALLRDEITRLNKILEQEKSINKDLSEAILNMSKRG
ncbi:MAG: hypothetical protein H7246_20990 [Phycisphaerae bacterium]|nr:hypothetical protein [Saprospiraceae bacterium]